MQKLILGSIFAAISFGAAAADTATIVETSAWFGPDKALLSSGALVAAGLIAAALDHIDVDRGQ